MEEKEIKQEQETKTSATPKKSTPKKTTTKPKKSTPKKATTKKTTPKSKPEPVEEKVVPEYDPLAGVKVNEPQQEVKAQQEVKPKQEVKSKTQSTKKEEELFNIAQEIQKKIKEMKVLSDKEIYESYVSEGRPYLIYYNGRLVFDSTLSEKKNLKFLEEGFQIHGRIYNYTGIRFKFKKRT